MIKLYYLICTFLCVPFLTSSQGLAKDNNLDMLVQLEWLIYGEQESDIRDSLLFQKASIYKSQNDFEKALSTLDRISYAPSPNLENQILSERVVLNFLLHRDAEVQNLILQGIFLENYQRTYDIQLIEVLNNIRLHKIEDAKMSLYQLVSDSSRVEQLFDYKKVKSPQTAFKLSFMIPGSGQMYAGKFFKGLFSMGVNASLFYIGIRGIQRRYFFTEALTSVGLFQGFFFGGAEYAKELAVERNNLIVQELSNRVLGTIQ